MKTQQRTLLQSIQQNYNNQQFTPIATPNGLYVSQTNTRQQLFLEKLINIYVLRKKQYNKINQSRIQLLIQSNSGSFTDLLLGLRYMAYCMENKIQVSYQKFGMLKLLTNWMDIFQKIKTQPKVNLCNSVFGAIHPQNHTISSVEELIVYANYIAVDLQTILQRPVQGLAKNVNQSSSQIESSSQKLQLNYSHLDIQDILMFVNNLIPKTIFNIVIAQPLISGRPMTAVNPMDERQKDFLYSSKSIQYFAKQKSHYQHLTKLLIWTALKLQLTQSQQKNLMLVGMKYFYLFNRNKLQQPFSIWIKIFQKITQAVRFALSDQLILFIKVITKLGHHKFVTFLRNKYQFIQELHKKMDPNGVIGYPKDSLNVFHSLAIMQHIFISPGTLTQRYIQILEPYSLLYFYIGIKTLDINIRFYYLGQFTSSVQKKQLLLTKQKCQIQFKGNIIAIQKGIYMFEFGNEYSWMKGKSIFYDTTVLTPLQIGRSGIQRDKFLPVLFNKFEMNSCPQDSLIDINHFKQQSLSSQFQIKSSNELSSQLNHNNNNNNDNNNNNNNNNQINNNEININNKLNINTQYDNQTKVYNLKTVSNNKIYEYESQSGNLFNKKAKQIFETLQQSVGSTYQLYLDGKYQLTSIQILHKWCIDPIEFALQMQQSKQQTVQNKVENIQQKQIVQVLNEKIVEQKLKNQQLNVKQVEQKQIRQVEQKQGQIKQVKLQNQQQQVKQVKQFKQQQKYQQRKGSELVREVVQSQVDKQKFAQFEKQYEQQQQHKDILQQQIVYKLQQVPNKQQEVHQQQLVSKQQVVNKQKQQVKQLNQQQYPTLIQNNQTYNLSTINQQPSTIIQQPSTIIQSLISQTSQQIKPQTNTQVKHQTNTQVKPQEILQEIPNDQQTQSKTNQQTQNTQQTINSQLKQQLTQTQALTKKQKKKNKKKSFNQ